MMKVKLLAVLVSCAASAVAAGTHGLRYDRPAADSQEGWEREHPAEASVIGIVPTVFTHDFIEEMRLAKELRRAHEHAKVFYAVLTHKTKANTEKLIAFRRANGFPLYTWAEQYFGDLTGVESLLGKEKKANP